MVNPTETESTELSEGDCYVALTYDDLDALAIMNRVRSPKAGATVLFAGHFPLRDLTT